MKANEIRTLFTGGGLVESLRWQGDRPYFSGWSAGEVGAVDFAGHGEVVASVTSVPLCTAWLPDCRLLGLEPDGSLVAHADLRPWVCNDVVADGRGNSTKGNGDDHVFFSG